MSKTVRAHGPATVANIGCGFDILGAALNCPGDVVTAREVDSPTVLIRKIEGDGGKLPLDPKLNSASVAVSAMLDALDRPCGIELEIKKQMPLGSGLGSSAASSVAALWAVNTLLDNPFSALELVPFAMQGEKAACGTAHADNVAPGLMGGFVLIRSSEPPDIITLSYPESLTFTVVHPHFELKTSDARRVLFEKIPLKYAIKQWGNAAALVAGLIKEDTDLISRSLEDFIIEPQRSTLIPGYNAVKEAALKAGALGCSISGAGPSVFALCESEGVATLAGEKMSAAFKAAGLSSDIYVSSVNAEGPLILD
ncbi:MAG: homoserine kinase [Candidatus Dadabacteria bacterium]|nr:MAG: homoserine kinase [Candidatus Dadabacteria bacterium]